MESKCCQHCETAKEDHDLLVTINQKITTDFALLKDHETRLRSHEGKLNMGIGGLFVLQVVMGIFFTLYIAYKFQH
jgi:hypothetical protein